MQTNANLNQGEATTPEPLGLKNPLLPTTPLGQNWLSPKFLTPLGAKPLAAHDPLIFSPQGIPDYHPPDEAFQDLPFFPDRPRRTPPSTSIDSPSTSISETKDAAKTALQPRLESLPIQRQTVNSRPTVQSKAETPIQRQTATPLPATPLKPETSEQRPEKTTPKDFHSFLQEVIQARSTTSPPTSVPAETPPTISPAPYPSDHPSASQTQLETIAPELASPQIENAPSDSQTQLPVTSPTLSNTAETSSNPTSPLQSEPRLTSQITVQARHESAVELREGLSTPEKIIPPDITAKANTSTENISTLQTQSDLSNSPAQTTLNSQESNLSSDSIDVNSTASAIQTQRISQAIEPEVTSDATVRSTQTQPPTHTTQPEATESEVLTNPITPSVNSQLSPTIQARLQSTHPQPKVQAKPETSISSPPSIPKANVPPIQARLEDATEPGNGAIGQESHLSQESASQSIDSAPSVIQTRLEATTATPENIHLEQDPVSDSSSIAGSAPFTVDSQQSQINVPPVPLHPSTPTSNPIQPKTLPSSNRIQPKPESAKLESKQDAVGAETAIAASPAELLPTPTQSIQLKSSPKSQSEDIQTAALTPSIDPSASPTIQASTQVDTESLENSSDGFSEDIPTSVSATEFSVSTSSNTSTNLNSSIINQSQSSPESTINPESSTAHEISASTLSSTIQTQRATNAHDQLAIEEDIDSSRSEVTASVIKATSTHSQPATRNKIAVSTPEVLDSPTKPTVQLQAEASTPPQDNRNVSAKAGLPAPDEQAVTSMATKAEAVDPISQTANNQLQRHVDSPTSAQVVTDLASEVTDTIELTKPIPQGSTDSTNQSVSTSTQPSSSTPLAPITNLLPIASAHLVSKKQEEFGGHEEVIGPPVEQSSIAPLHPPSSQVDSKTTTTEPPPQAVPTIQTKPTDSAQTKLNPSTDEIPTVSVPAIAEHYSLPSVQAKAAPVSIPDNQAAPAFTIPDAWSSIDELLSRSRVSSPASTVQRLVNPLEDQISQPPSGWSNPLESSQDDSWTSLLNTGEEIGDVFNPGRNDIPPESPQASHSAQAAIAADEEISSGNPQAEATSGNESQGETESDSLEALARGIYHLICQRLEVERERGGHHYTSRFPW